MIAGPTFGGPFNEAVDAFTSLRQTGRLFLTLRGASMTPELWPGDLLRAQRCAISDVARGEIVVFEQEGRLIAHRVIAHAECGLLTRGDAAAHADPVVTPDRFLGVVDAGLRNGRGFRPRQRPPVHRRALAALLRRWPLLSKLAQRLRTVAPGGLL